MLDLLRAHIQETPDFHLALGGILIGMIFGAIIFRTNFCAMGSISDMLTFGDYRRFRAWLLAIAVALIGTQLLAATGIVDLSRSMYMAPVFNWSGNIIGGLMFGFGMVLAGGCASRNLVRAGGGDVRSVVILLVLGLFAYMSLGGILGPLRDALQQATAVNLGNSASPSAGALLASLTGMNSGVAGALMAVLVATVLLGICFSDKNFRGSAPNIFSGIGIGLCVVAGWALTGLAYDEFAAAPNNPMSLSYVRPTGDTLEYLERFTAGMVPGFGVATVIGAFAGAMLAAIASGRFRITGFADSSDTLRGLTGGALMGTGGIVALGCTIGQAVTGISTLALGSFLAFAAIVAGGIAGIKYLERQLMA